MTARSAASHKARFLLAAAARRGHDPAALARRYGLDPARVEDVDGRVPLAVVCRMWEELPGLLDEPDLPVLVTEVAEALDPPLPVWLFLTAPTLGDALARMVRYERVGFDVADEPVSSVSIDGDRAVIALDAARCAVPPPAGAVAQTLAAVLSLARRATASPVVPRAVTLRWPAPPRLERWVAAFGVRPRFDADADALVLARSDLARPHPDASRTLSSLATRHADAALAALGPPDPLDDVRRAARSGLLDGEVDLASAAARARTSVRTLQRRLRASGTTWRAVLEEERRTLAVRLLADRRSSVLEVALAAGFADGSAFGRAFRRWTGVTPAAWRVARSVAPVAPPVEQAAEHRWEDGSGADP